MQLLSSVYFEFMLWYGWENFVLHAAPSGKKIGSLKKWGPFFFLKEKN